MSNRAERRRADKLAAKSGNHSNRFGVANDHRRESLNNLKVRPQSEIVADEKLVSCAIMRPDMTICKGFRSHWELRANLGYEDPSKFERGDIPGFWTSKDRFVERSEAMNIAYHAGQVRQLQQREFLSSDVDVW